jgi:hypothetical protein
MLTAKTTRLTAIGQIRLILFKQTLCQVINFFNLLIFNEILLKLEVGEDAE